MSVAVSGEPVQDAKELTLYDQHLHTVVWASLAFMMLLFTLSVLLVIAFLVLVPDQVHVIIEPLIRGKVISRTVVLFLIVPAITALTLLDKITGAAALAALSAVAGYVLGASTAPS